MRLHRVFEALADPVDVLGEDAHAVVELARLGGDLLRVLGQRLLAPAIVDRLQQGDERRWRRDQDALLEGVFDQAGLLLEGGGEEGVARQEEHHELRRVGELAGVGGLGELAHLLLQLPGVGDEMHGALGLGLGLDGGEVGIERRLGVDDHTPSAGQADDEVGPSATVVGVARLLLDEVDVVQHAGELDHAAELHLAPAAARFGAAESLDQVAGLELEFLLRAEQ